jgi:phospholipase C
MLGHGDMIWYSDGKGNAIAPPHDVSTGGTTPAGIASVLDEVENPNPASGTNNWYTEDGYGSGSPGAHPYGGGSYSNCEDTTQPGVQEIVSYLESLPRPINPRCEAGHYYLLNNYNPGYFGNGNNASTDTSPFNTVFTVPPSSLPSIGDDLNNKGVSWKYYGDQWNAYVPDPYQLNYGPVGGPNELKTPGVTIQPGQSDEYCTICNPFQYDTSIMTDATVRAAHIQDITGAGGLYSDIANGTLPAVSFVKPSAFVDGHPSSSKLNLFEGFTQDVIDAVQANPSLWKDTAIFITFDEGGGYYDSGYVQPLDYFGDGTRIPMIVVSRYTKAGHISHNYSDHVSILKFIEKNWDLPPVTERSRDNFPNPVTFSNPYVPVNSPAISDLMDLFDFGH